jgi:colanic acid/amylovoran biosynthesis glycosyltransferase
LTPPLRLLVVGVRWPPETFIWRRLAHLPRYGIAVTVATPSQGARPLAEEPRVVPMSLPHWSTPWPEAIARVARDAARALGHSAASRAALAELVRDRAPFPRLRQLVPLLRERPDVVHFDWPNAAIAYLPLWDVWSAPVVVSCRGTQINVAPGEGDDAYLVGLREIFARAAAVHCVSAAIRDEAIPLGLDPAKAAVIRPGVDPDRFQPAAPAARDHLRVIAVGTWTWVKGYEYALSALRRLVDRGVPVRLALVGDGPERQRMLYTIADLGLAAHVELLGRLPPERVIEELRASDVALLSSLSEGIANSIVEAMACGLPVVTTACGGMAEVVSAGEHGFVVAPRDVDAMAGALERLARDPDLRARMGGAARAHVAAELDIAQHAARFAALYREVCT